MNTTDQEIAKHLQLARQRVAGAAVYAFHDDRQRALPAELPVEGERWRIVRADSELAIRAALVDRPADVLLAIVTPLRTSDLARDVRARIAGFELFAFDPWESLLGPFKATSVDPRLRRNTDLGRALLRCSTSSGFRPARTGVLSADEAWGAYFSHVLGLDDEPTEIEGWVQWFMDHPTEAALLVGADHTLGEQVIDRAVGLCGEAARLVFRVGAGAVRDSVDLGARLHALAHAVLAALNAGTDSTATKFLTRLESYFGDEPLQEADLRVFAAEVLRTDPGTRDVAGLLDGLFADQYATALAFHSDISALGYRDRRRRVADLCKAHLCGNAARETLLEAFEALRSHRNFTAEDAVHQGRVRALVRLAVRMADVGKTEHPSAAADLAIAYIQEQSFIDALRERIELGDLGNDFADATTAVLGAARAHSTARNERFASALAKAIKLTPSAPGAFFVHDMLRVAAAPLVGERPLLVLVIDGLSWFVLRQLTFDPMFQQWLAVAPARDGKLLPMFATVPSVTTFSRCSLLTGKLQKGGQGPEATGFAAEPNLVNAMSNKHRAVLFHKAALDAAGPGKVGPAVVDALRSDKNRVVGVVLNGVDDQLSGAPQLAFEWKIEAIPPLRSLLELAEETRRDVLIVADHGHIWDNGTSKGAAGESARYRSGTTAAAGEVVMTGPMIEASGEGDAIIAAFDEGIRYTGGKRGYHGGASLQEVVAPCLLLTLGSIPNEQHWQSLGAYKPAWWDFRQAETTAKGAPVAPPKQNEQLSLIDRPGAKVEPGPQWLGRVLSSDLFAQRRASIPAVPEVERIATILATLDANGGRAHVNTLAEAITMPPMRVARLVPTLQRLLNVEGFAVLDFDRGEQLLRLDVALLKKQFRLE